MAEWEDCYEVLGVAPNATVQEIREAYRYKVQILHPDRLINVPQSVRLKAQKDLIRVNCAYAVLSNDERRAQFHSEWIRRHGRAEGTDWQGAPPGQTNASSGQQSGHARQSASPGQESRGTQSESSPSSHPRNWFERHLNWTFFLGSIPAYLYSLSTTDPYTVETDVQGLALVLILIEFLLVTGWVLRQKERSLWWLLVPLVPVVGMFAVYFLGNEEEKRRKRSSQES